MPNPTLTLFVVALLAAPAASAQFTSVVAPPPRPEPAVVQTVASPGAVSADTSAAGRMADMRAWVDSAAVAVNAQSPQDTATPPVVIEQPTAEPLPASPEPDVSEFREGAPAPNTATPLPALVLLGMALLAGGTALRRR